MKIAIFGAGQLAMMMIEESSDLGHEFIVIDPASRPPAVNYPNIIWLNIMMRKY